MLSINLIGLLVADITCSVKFYCKAFGFEVVQKKAICGDGNWRAFLKRGETVIELTQFKDDSAAPLDGAIDHIAFFVEDLEAEIERLERSGVDLHMHAEIPHHISLRTIKQVKNGRFFYFRGPDGELIGLVELSAGGSFL
ncbi:MAG TPA: VOC family protein [Anaerolineae bacterium]|nr:VOC family protein [Anaerolineae bacterium]